MKKILFFLMAFSLCLVLAIPCFASGQDFDFNEPPYDDTYFPYYIITSDNRAFVFNNKPYSPDGNLVTFNPLYSEEDSEYNYFEYYYEPGDDWYENGGYTNSINLDLDTVVYTSHDILQGSKVVFANDKDFWSSPSAPSGSLDSVISDSLNNNFLGTFGNTVTTLVLVGVGILATFVLVSFLRKKSLLHF